MQLYHKTYKIFILLVLSCIFATNISAAVLSGTITDENSNPLAFANVYVKNSTYGGSTDLKGYYFLELKPGTHQIVYSYVGHEEVIKEITIKSGERKELNVVLPVLQTNLSSFTVVTKYEDKSKQIMRNVRAKRKEFITQVDDYSCNSYLKTSIEKEKRKKNKKDTTNTPTDSLKASPDADFQSHVKNEKLNLLETMSMVYYKSPGKFKENVTAQHDYVERKGHIGSGGASVGITYGEEDIAPQSFMNTNPYVIYNDIHSSDLNIYRNQIDFPALSDKPILSPIAATSNISYNYRIAASFYEDGQKIYKMEVIPLFKSEALFNGFIYIEDSTWIVRSVDLNVNRRAMKLCRDFKIIQNYEMIDSTAPMAVRTEMIYTIRDGYLNIHGNTRIINSDYQLNTGLPNVKFNSEVKTFEVDAFDKDSTYWESERPVTLKESELEFIEKTDSLALYYISDEYYAKIDSSFNQVTWWVWLTGWGHRNRAKGTEVYVGGLPNQLRPFSVGGYAHCIPGYFNKEFENNFLLETRGEVSYGFKNKDLKGKLGVGLTYFPKKFVRTFIEVGDHYDQINNYASIEQVFSRSNYVRTKTFSIAQRMEIINGLYAELTFMHSDQNPIKNLQLAEWSQWMFGDLNEPVDFERYKKTEIKLEVKYRFKQKYVIKKNKKYILGTDFPEIRFIYRKGLPGVLDSEVNFDYFEIGGSYDTKISRFGTSYWSFRVGGFVNKKNLRLLEYKYFRGSDRFFFSNPTQSFQLLGKTFLTPNEFLQGNYIHHFEGTLLNKVPLINRLKLGIAVGGGALIIPEDKLSHVELFFGLERKVKIKKQLFRFGVYAVTSDSSFDKMDFTLKFALDFYNSFTNKWSY